MSRLVLAATLLATVVSAQNNCYYGPGSGFRGPSDLVPCNTTAEVSACCLRGDTCLTGNACYNYASGNVYQYGCTDLNYEDESCPKKCNFDPGKSPWAGLEYCSDIPNLSDTWTCLSPESCGCEWNSTIGYNLALLPSRGCGAMGSDARVALYAPSTLLPYVSLPYSGDGSTGYYSTTTDSEGNPSIISTAVAFYTPDPQDFTQPTTYRAVPSTAVYINAAATASPSTLAAAEVWTATTPYTPPATTSGASSTGTQSTAPATTSGASSTGTQSTASATSTSSSSSSDGGLSTGAQIGIGVGVAGGVLFAASLGICFYLYRRKRKTAAAAAQQPQQPQQPPLPSPGYIPQDPNYSNPYMQQQSPPQMQMHGTNWAPVYPPGQMPFFVPAQEHKQAPPYSPPSSPPPTELDGSQFAREAYEADSVVSGGHSPRPAHASVDTRFSEGPM